MEQAQANAPASDQSGLAKSPGTLGLIAAGFIAFLSASAMFLDAYASQSHAPALQSPAVPDDRLPINHTVDAAREILDQQRRVEAQLAELTAIVASHADQPPPPPPERAPPARIDRYLGAIQEQVAGLERFVASELPDERRQEAAARFETLKRTLAEARALVGAQAAVGTPRPAELMLTMQSAPPAGPSPTALAWTKLYIVMGMFAALGIAFLAAVTAIFTTSNAAVLAFATDTVKTLLGFFIGVVTAFLGAPG